MGACVFWAGGQAQHKCSAYKGTPVHVSASPAMMHAPFLCHRLPRPRACFDAPCRRVGRISSHSHTAGRSRAFPASPTPPTQHGPPHLPPPSSSTSAAKAGAPARSKGSASPAPEAACCCVAAPPTPPPGCGRACWQGGGAGGGGADAARLATGVRTNNSKSTNKQARTRVASP